MNPFFNNGQQQQLPQHHLQQLPSQQQQQPPRAQAHQLPIMNSAQLLELVNSISPNEKIDQTVKQALIKLAESFVLDVTSKSADIARHRHSKAIEQRDIALYLEREWDMTFPPSASSSARLNNSSSSGTAATSAETVQQRQIQRNIAITHAIGTKSSTRMTPSSTHISRNSQATRIANSAAALLHSTNAPPPPPPPPSSSSGGPSNNSHKYRN